MCVSVYGICTYVSMSGVSGCSKMSEEGVGSLGAGVTGGFELPNMGAGNQSCILCKSSKCF